MFLFLRCVPNTETGTGSITLTKSTQLSHASVCRSGCHTFLDKPHHFQTIYYPGILDHPLEERNTIEMQAIVALAHLTCSVLFFLDISEQCGYTIEQQCSLFQSIKPLFANKQLVLVVNKVDQQPWDTLDSDKKEMIQALADDAHCTIKTMSNLTEHGVSEVKTLACEKLLASRVDVRVSGKKVEGVLNRLQVFVPQPRDNIARQPFIPESVVQRRNMERNNGAAPTDGNDDDNDNEDRHKPQRSRIGYAPTVHDVVATTPSMVDDDNDGDVDMGPPPASQYNTTNVKTTRDRMWENGGPGVWAPDYREIYNLKDDSWKFDAIPEIIDGKNIADFVDADILAKLDALEQEEEQILAELQAAKMGEEIESDLDSEEEAAVEAIRERKKKIKNMKLVNQTQNKPMMPHAIRGKSKDKHDVGKLNTAEIKKTMDQLGVDASKMIERGRQMDERERGRKRERSLSRRLADKDQVADGTGDVDMEDAASPSKKSKSASSSSKSDMVAIGRARSHSRPREPSQMGLRDEMSVKEAKKLEREGRKGWIGGAGEGDNRKSVHLVKWMHTGKRRGQKTSTIGR